MDSTIIAALIFVAILIVLGLFYTRMGNLGFWKLASMFPSEFMAYISRDDTWIISETSTPRPGPDYVGPLKFVDNNIVYTLFAKAEFIEKSQQEFISKYKPLTPEKTFPYVSLLALIYPIAAILSYKGASLLSALGYGFSNLGYLLAAAFVFGGSFRILGLDHRVQVIIAAIIFWVVGVIITNV
ncbi:hypothetical protein [Marinobacter gelidimuriae]|uniref:hypothetical protein n=1 Tax=Marinobacter gelidimuriae TaxID=2739064 RepID=UPI00036EBFD1|nr:hypothetical protein [Marinobacter gelidimuriae]